MRVSVSIPIEIEEYIESIDGYGERVPKGADSMAEEKLYRKIELGELDWRWEWEE